MKWSEISIHTTNEAVEPISNILHEAGASGVVIEDPAELTKVRDQLFGEIYDLNPNDYPADGIIIKAYMPLTSFSGEALDTIQQKITGLLQYNIDLGRNIVTTSEVKDEDWETAWKQYYHPVKISETFTIVPTWEDYKPVHSDELILELDPGMAFGTGTHPTTVMCIQALEKVVKDGDFVIDVGTGSGVLSIAAALLGAEQVTALDLDDVAVSAAKINVELNSVSNRVTVKHNDLLNEVKGEADIVVANILAEVIVRLAPAASETVKSGGLFITSGIIQQKKEEVKAALIDTGFVIEETLDMENWTAFIARRT